MKKQRLDLAYALRANSANIIWKTIGSAHGLEKWMADSVTQEDDILTFRWGELWASHEIRTAHVVELLHHERITLRWDGDEDPDAFWQLGMERSDITGDYVLTVVDFAAPEDLESLRDIWDSNVERLHRTTGL